MTDDHPRIDSRSRRLIAYLRHNRERILTDATLLVAWVLATTTGFDWLDLPIWLLYLVLFVGVVVYSQVTPTWDRPYRGPDQTE